MNLMTLMLLSIIPAALVLLVLYLGHLRGLNRFQLGLIALLLVLVWVGVDLGRGQVSFIDFVLGYALLLAAIWAGGLRSKVLLGIILWLALTGLVVFNEPFATWQEQQQNTPFGQFLLSVFGVLLPAWVVASAAVLVQRAVNPAAQKTAADAGADLPAGAAPVRQVRRLGWAQGLQLGLAAFLLGGLVYTVYWSSVWDHTSDGLAGIFFLMIGGLTGIGAGMLLSIFSSGRRRWTGRLFMLGVPVGLLLAFQLGWQVSYHTITEERAAAIAGALESFKNRTGAYPQALDELAPRDMLVVPQPVILKGKSWCYQGIAGTFRLGAVFREYFSSPLSIRVYASSGEPLPSSWECDTHLAELKLIYDERFEIMGSGFPK